MRNGGHSSSPLDRSPYYSVQHLLDVDMSFSRVHVASCRWSRSERAFPGTVTLSFPFVRFTRIHTGDSQQTSFAPAVHLVGRACCRIRGSIRTGRLVFAVTQARLEPAELGVRASLDVALHRHSRRRLARGIALADIAVLFCLIVSFIIVSRRYSVAASWLFVPYAIWVGFAAALNASIWSAN